LAPAEPIEPISGDSRMARSHAAASCDDVARSTSVGACVPRRAVSICFITVLASVAPGSVSDCTIFLPSRMSCAPISSRRASAASGERRRTRMFESSETLSTCHMSKLPAGIGSSSNCGEISLVKYVR